jgi:multiple sugar transport system substrate-binding protein
MKRKAFLVVLSLLFLFSAAYLGFCTKGEEEKGAAVEKKAPVKMEEITVQMWAGPESRAMLEAVNVWNEKYAEDLGINVSLITIGRVGYPEKITSQLMSGVDKPDLIQVFSLQTGSMYPYLEVLNEYFESEHFSSPDGTPYQVGEMIPATLDSGKVEGKQYTIPTDVSWHLIFYRKDLMDLKANPVETYEEFVPFAKKFVKSMNPDSKTPYATITIGKLVWYNTALYLQTLWSYGGSMFKEGSMEPAFDTEAAMKAGKFLNDLGRSGVMLPDFENAEFPETVAAFQNEQIAFAIFWNAMLPMLNDCEQSPKVCDKIDIVEVPGAKMPDGSIQKYSYIHCINLGLNKNSKLKDKAVKFLSWATFGEGSHIYAENGGAPPVYSVFTGPDAVEPYKSGAEWIAKYGRAAYPFADLQPYLELMKNYCQRLMLEPDYKKIMAELQKASTDFMKERGYLD